jgi:hypothetical protein
LRAEIKAVLERVKAGQENLDAMIKRSQEETSTMVMANVENMEAMINSILPKLEDTIKNWPEDMVLSVDQWTQGLCKEFYVKIVEMQLGLQAITISSLCGPRTSTRNLMWRS